MEAEGAAADQERQVGGVAEAQLMDSGSWIFILSPDPSAHPVVTGVRFWAEAEAGTSWHTAAASGCAHCCPRNSFLNKIFCFSDTLNSLFCLEPAQHT